MDRRKFFAASATIPAAAAVSVASLGVSVAQAQSSNMESRLDKIQSSGVLRVGWDTFQQWNFEDTSSKEPIGISVDLANAMAKILGAKVEFVRDRWATIIAGLAADKFDIVVPIFINAKRALVAEFSEPITIEPSSAIVPADKVEAYSDVMELDKAGTKIAVVLGSFADIVLTPIVQNAELVRLDTVGNSVLAVRSGRADAYAQNATSLGAIVKEFPDLAVVPGSYAISKTAFVLPREDQVFINWVNVFVEEMKLSARLKPILTKWGIPEDRMAI